MAVARTKLRDRILPSYTKGEEIFNMVSHIIGAALGIAALVLCVVFSAKHHDPWAVVGSSIYGASLIMLYTMSSIYHGLRPNMGKKVLQILDHCTIYFLIAGTYTPVCLAGLRRVSVVACWVMFGVIWGLAALAITLTAIDIKKYQAFSMICYVGMGWGIMFAFRPLIEAITLNGFYWLIGGGLCYTIGAILYGVGKKLKWIHSIFHLFVLAGSILHFFAMIFYVI
ncbi:MAG: hemolysin III family protein [Lachnospiraceae bacterium]|nr:hemolysin III family protein [Lachnospiraceae bacterium]